MQDTWVRSLGWEDPLRRRWQYSCLGYSIRNGILVEHRFHRGTWWATVHVVAKSKDTTEQLTVSLSHAFKLSCYLCFALKILIKQTQLLCITRNSNTSATWCEELTHLKRPWCWERLKAGGEGDNRWWDGWMALPTQWMWVWVNSGSWWWTGRPDVLQSMGSQRVRHDWAIELNWTDDVWCGASFQMLICYLYIFFGEMSVKAFGTFFNPVVFLLLSFKSSLYILGNSPFLAVSFANISFSW